MQERGDGWSRMKLDDWGRATQYLDYDIYRDGSVVYENPYRGGSVVYENPYRGDHMSKADALRIVEAVTRRNLDEMPPHVKYVYRRPDDSDTKFLWGEVCADRFASVRDLEFTMIRIIGLNIGGRSEEDTYDVYVHPLKDDWFVVDFHSGGLWEFVDRPIFRCDQVEGVESLMDEFEDEFER